ncbi:MAG: HAMP domain-containing sensor histidine kinase [Acidobacteriota bacterium]
MRRTLSEHVLRWVAGLLLLALLALGGLQHRWLEQLHSAQSERRNADLSGSLEALRDAFDQRFFAWALTHEMALAELAHRPDRSVDALDDLAATVSARYFRRQGGEAASPWWRLEAEGRATVLDSPPEILGGLPPDAESLIPYPLDAEHLAVLLAEVPAPEALATKLYATRAAGDVPSALASPGPVMLVVLRRQRFIAELLEPLAQRYLAGLSAALDYALIERQGSTESIVHRSAPDLERADLTPADGEVQLLRMEAMLREATRSVTVHSDFETGLCLDCESPGAVGLTLFVGSEPDRRWLLRVRARHGSMTELIDQLQARNLWISLSGLAILGSAILLLVVLAIRTQRLARTQMEFVSSVSHELRTPLAVMAQASSNLAGGVVEEPQKVRQYGEVLRQETRRLQELIDRVLTFARLDEGTLETTAVEVGGVVDRVVAALNDQISEKALELDVRLAADLPAVQANATALESALRNLIDNATRYGADGGRLRIEAAVEHGADGDEVRIGVRDWGEGIEPAEQKRLFEAFFRGRRARERQSPGTGLGLSLVKRIASALGGRVRVDSQIGLGSTFHLYLPLAPASPQMT